MTRREVSLALAGSVLGLPGSFAEGEPQRAVTLQAIAGVRLPATLTITTSSPEKVRRGLWELRTYRVVAPRFATNVAAVFPRAGIHPVLSGTANADLTYLIPFETLTARERAWTLLNADPGWSSLQPQFKSYHFGLYQVVYHGADHVV